VTFRAASAERLRNLHHVLGWLADVPGLDTLVVEQADRPALDPHSLPASCRVRFARNPGPFNQSWGFNVGFRATTADVLVFADADILVNRDHLAQSLALCARTRGGPPDGNGCEVVRPWSDIVDLTDDETADLAGGRLDLSQVELGARRGAGRPGEYPPLCGGAYVIRREVYERLGGQDERFFGWGGEDDAMSIKVARLCGRVARVHDSAAFHLHHPRHASLPVDHESNRSNVFQRWEYNALSPNAQVELCRTQGATMGDASRFAATSA
jgi:glycosyltransferase involved in cell wall biosynthesis